MKVTVWNTSSGEPIAAVDVDDDSLSKCLVLGTPAQCTVVLSRSVRGRASSSSKNGRRSPRCYAWTPKSLTPRLIELDRRCDSSLCHVSAQQTAVIAVWRRDGSTTTLNYWSVQHLFIDDARHRLVAVGVIQGTL